MRARRTSLLLALNVLAAMCVAQEGKTYAVAGEVNRPGIYELKDDMRVMDALNLARGFKEFADRKKIVIIRRGERYHFDYEAYLRGEKTEANLVLENGDTIVVR